MASDRMLVASSIPLADARGSETLIPIPCPGRHARREQVPES